MPRFEFGAVDPATGRESRGSIDSPNREQAAQELKSRRLALTSLALAASPARNRAAGDSKTEPLRRPHFRRRHSKGRRRIGFRPVVNRRSLTQFTRQLATLTKAGVPLVRALEIVARPSRDPAFRDVIAGLADGIRAGRELSTGMQEHPRIFDRLYVSMVKAGEAGGVMDSVLERLARFLERMERIKGRVKAAMMYPLVILMVALGILSGLMVFVVPKFEQVFSGLLKGRPLPPLTQFVLGAGNFVSHHGLAAAGIIASAMIAWRVFHRSQAGARFTDGLLIRSPVLGSLLLKASVARFTRTFGSLLASGVPMLDALAITRDTSGNIHVAAAISQVHERVKSGNAVAGSLAVTGIFPGFVTSMIEVGEETGELSGMLIRIADGYDEEVDNAVTALTSIVEPVMIVLMAAMVGTIVIALFLPIVSIIQHLQ